MNRHPAIETGAFDLPLLGMYLCLYAVLLGLAVTLASTPGCG